MVDYSSYSDMELSNLLKEADQAAFREIYERYNELLYLFAFKKLKNDAEARDVVHDVFAWMLEHGTTLTLKTSLSSYLYKSVLNKVFDIFRRQDTFQRYVELGEQFIDVDSRETDYLIREKDVREMIDREIAAMPPRMREVYELRYRHHMSTEQISDQLGITPQTVTTHLKHGNRHLKDKLGIAIFVIYILMN